jgi:hypothetical protein
MQVLKFGMPLLVSLSSCTPWSNRRKTSKRTGRRSACEMPSQCRCPLSMFQRACLCRHLLSPAAKINAPGVALMADMQSARRVANRAVPGSGSTSKLSKMREMVLPRRIELPTSPFIPPRFSPPLARLWAGLSLYPSLAALDTPRLVSTPSRFRAWLGITI